MGNNLTISSPVIEKEIARIINNDSKGPSRAYSLDALRGLSILLMVFSAAIPYGVLPSWMYHAQVPPPDHIFNPNLPGITWVDLIFPFFLFTMGAAIPLALSNKLKKYIPAWKIIISLLNRSLLLAGFAIYIYHINPGVINPNPDWKTWLLSLLGFLLLFPVLARFPNNWNTTKQNIVRGTGFCSIILFLSVLHFIYGRSFSVYQSDIIILVLANVAFFGGVIWLVSRDNMLFRISFMGILIALRLSSTLPGWIQNFSNGSPIPWLFEVSYLQYLFIIIPGTIVGDLILKSMNHSDNSSDSGELPNRNNLLLISIILIIINIVVVIGLKIRVGFEIFPIIILLSCISWLLIKRTVANKNLIHRIFGWGVYWLVLGFLFEPFEGGIKKDHPTLSFYFITTGLAVFVLITFHILIEILSKRKPFDLLIECGQNPLIAYAGINNLVYPVLALVQVNAILDSISTQTWFGLLRGVLTTLLVAISARIFTRFKIYLRA